MHQWLKLPSFSYVSTANFVKTSLELVPVLARVAHLAAIWSTSASSSFSGTYPRTYAKTRCERKIRQPRLASKRPTDQQNQKVLTRTQASTAVATRMSPKTPKGNKASKIILQRSLRNPLPWTWFPPNRSGTTFRPWRSLHRCRSCINLTSSPIWLIEDSALLLVTVSPIRVCCAHAW